MTTAAPSPMPVFAAVEREVGDVVFDRAAAGGDAEDGDDVDGMDVGSLLAVDELLSVAALFGLEEVLSEGESESGSGSVVWMVMVAVEVAVEMAETVVAKGTDVCEVTTNTNVVSVVEE